jgi:hypothetical protein
MPTSEILAPASTPQPPRLGAPQAATSAAQPPAAPKKPVRVSAEFVQAVMRRLEGKLDWDHVRCEKRVQVHQDPTVPGERGLEVRSETLDMACHADGKVLTLNGTPQAFARVEIQKLTLEGPQVVFDQRDRRVSVDGAGIAIMQTATQLTGEPLERPTDVVIRWNRRMNFEGNRVSFEGGVQAEQEVLRPRVGEKEVNRILCPHMDVYLDRALKFDPGQGTQSFAPRGPDDSPQVKRVVCHRGDDRDPAGLVHVAGNLWRHGKRVRFQQIDAPEITFVKETEEVTATCTERSRGELRLFQAGNDSMLGLGEKPASEPTATEGFKLTRVQFHKQMRGNNRTQSINFSGSVRVWHAPADDPNVRIDVDNLPHGAFTLTCQDLEVRTHGDSGGKRYVEMIAAGKADIYANDFSGRADVIKYDESKKQQVIFDSSEGNPAALYHIKEKGKPPMEVLGKQIIYWRDGNQFRGSGLVGATGAK